MSWFTNIFSGNTDKLVDSVSQGLDNLFTSDDERNKAKIILEKNIQDFKVEMKKQSQEYDKQITQRHTTDMKSDSWLSKNIRPLTLIFILVMYSLLSISSGFDFEVTESYVSLLGKWGMLIMSFYFGGRTLEKVTKVVKG